MNTNQRTPVSKDLFDSGPGFSPGKKSAAPEPNADRLRILWERACSRWAQEHRGVPSGSASSFTTIVSKLAPTMSDGATFTDPEPLMAAVTFSVSH
ncbi:hypothetical protein D3C78_704500 [compost metagenome]